VVQRGGGLRCHFVAAGTHSLSGTGLAHITSLAGVLAIGYGSATVTVGDDSVIDIVVARPELALRLLVSLEERFETHDVPSVLVHFVSEPEVA